MENAEPEERYREAKLRLDLASGRLTSLDAQIVDVAGAMASWRASWRRGLDPEASAALVVSQSWPDQSDIETAFTEWLAAYHDALDAWGGPHGRRTPPTE